jgi:hypothetical protein
MKNIDQQSLQTQFISNNISPEKSMIEIKPKKDTETILLANLTKEQIQKCNELI